MSGHYVHRAAAWRLIVNGHDIGAFVSHRLISLELTEKRGSDADELSVVLSDADGRLALPAKGAIIELQLGWREIGTSAGALLFDKGRFKVDQLTHSGAPDILTIRARSADLTGSFRRRRSQSWSKTVLGNVLSEVAGRNALQLRCSPEKAAVAIDHLAQSNESDAALIARLGRMHDAVSTVKAGTLIFMSVGDSKTAAGQPLSVATITRASGDSHSWEEADRGSYSGVVAEWQDRAGGTKQKVVVGDEENAKKLGRTYATEESARRAAEAESKRLKRGSAKFSLNLAAGRPDLFPEKAVTVFGFKPQIDAQDWLISEVRHSLTNNGLSTTLQMERGNPDKAEGQG